MLRSMYAGVMGLRNEQLAMDVIGNNIANINTVGFKGGRARFAETFSQLIQGASPGGNGLGGTNPVQVGLGSVVAGIDNFFTQGNSDTSLRFVLPDQPALTLARLALIVALKQVLANALGLLGIAPMERM